MAWDCTRRPGAAAGAAGGGLRCGVEGAGEARRGGVDDEVLGRQRVLLTARAGARAHAAGCEPVREEREALLVACDE